MGTALIGLGGIVMLVGAIMMLVAAFKTSVVWGLCYLFVPFAALVFICTHWQESKKGFFIWLAGVPLQGIGLYLTLKAAAEAAAAATM